MAVLPGHWLGATWEEQDVNSNAVLGPQAMAAGGCQLTSLWQLMDKFLLKGDGSLCHHVCRTDLVVRHV